MACRLRPGLQRLVARASLASAYWPATGWRLWAGRARLPLAQARYWTSAQATRPARTTAAATVTGHQRHRRRAATGPGAGGGGGGGSCLAGGRGCRSAPQRTHKSSVWRLGSLHSGQVSLSAMAQPSVPGRRRRPQPSVLLATEAEREGWAQNRGKSQVWQKLDASRSTPSRRLTVLQVGQTTSIGIWLLAFFWPGPALAYEQLQGGVGRHFVPHQLYEVGLGEPAGALDRHADLSWAQASLALAEDAAAVGHLHFAAGQKAQQLSKAPPGTPPGAPTAGLLHVAALVGLVQAGWQGREGKPAGEEPDHGRGGHRGVDDVGQVVDHVEEGRGLLLEDRSKPVEEVVVQHAHWQLADQPVRSAGLGALWPPSQGSQYRGGWRAVCHLAWARVEDLAGARVAGRRAGRRGQARAIGAVHLLTTTLWLGEACCWEPGSSPRTGRGWGAERNRDRSSRWSTSLAGP